MTNEIPQETEDLLCDICKKYPENNCSKCNKIKLAFKAGQKQGFDEGVDKSIKYLKSKLSWGKDDRT